MYVRAQHAQFNIANVACQAAKQHRRVCGRLGDLTRETMKMVHEELAGSSDLDPEIVRALEGIQR